MPELRRPQVNAAIAGAVPYIMNIYDFAAVTGFEWDDGNSMKNAKHGVTDREAEQLFVNEPLLVVEDPRHSTTETRWHALGRTNDSRLLHVTFTRRAGGTRVRIISARPMHRKERRVYERASQANP
jgi:uncharacterized DUF497 family protein